METSGRAQAMVVCKLFEWACFCNSDSKQLPVCVFVCSFYFSIYKTVKLKAEARLDLLRQVGVSVDTWLKSAMNQVMEELENERWASLPTLTTHDPSHSVSNFLYN